MLINDILLIFISIVSCSCTNLPPSSSVELPHDPSSSQLYQILGSFQPFRSQMCQFKFENCIQDSSYADQLDNDCNIYSRLRDCFRTLLDDKQCLTLQLRRQYKKAKQNEYEACGIALSLESMQTAPDPTSTSTRRTILSAYLYLFVSVVLLRRTIWSLAFCLRKSLAGENSEIQWTDVDFFSFCINWIERAEIINTFNRLKWYLPSVRWSR